MVLTALLALKWPCCRTSKGVLGRTTPYGKDLARRQRCRPKSHAHFMPQLEYSRNQRGACSLSPLQISGLTSLFGHQISPSVQPSPPTSARILLAVTAPTSPNRAHHRRDRCDTSKLPAPPVSETQLRPIFLNAGTRCAVLLYFCFSNVSCPPYRLPYSPLIFPRQWHARRDERATEYDAPRSSHVGVNKGY